MQALFAEGARNYSYNYDKDMFTSLWVAYPLYESVMSGTESGSWKENPNVPDNYEINVLKNSYNVNYGSTTPDGYDSKQEYYSRIVGKCPCTGHTECDAILADSGKVFATPSLVAEHQDAALIHEAAIGKIAGEQLIKLMSLGLTEKEAEEQIVNGFLK